jgi:hypothetical protein
MTSGLEINHYDGIETVAAASPRGYQLYTALHRMQTDRMPNALYQRNGMPSSVEEWLIENGENDYVPIEFYVVPNVSGSRPDPFGIRTAPQFQIDYVAVNGLQPGYESLHLAFDPHDYQHFIRYTRSAKVLAWLANDSLAIDDLRLQAENFHLSFHPYQRDQYGGANWSGLLSMMRYVSIHPGKGLPYGRGEAWGLDCAAAAYSVLEPDWRAQKLRWFQQQAELLLDGQSACSGFIQSIVSNKAFDGQFHARQIIEQSITENALVGLRESVFREAYPGYAMMVRNVLERSLRAFISEMAWFPGMHAPWRYTGVGPLDEALPVWCTRAEMPPGTWSVGDTDGYQDWSSFAYGYELTNDLAFLNKARIQIGGASLDDLFQDLRNRGTDNIENRAPLLALVQAYLGEL